MLGRLITATFGREDLFNSAHDPAGNTPAVVTRPAAADKRTTITKVVWSYDGDPVGGMLTITVAGAQVLKHAITKGGPGALQFGALEGGNGQAVVITLAAGGAGVIGRLYVEGLLR